jgi:hypothetical protein
MNAQSEVRREDYDSVSLNHVLRRISSGYFRDLTTPIVESKFTKVIINGDEFLVNTEREKAMQAVLNMISDKCQRFEPRLLELEVEEFKKSGPKSLRPSSAWWSSIEGYFEDRCLDFDVGCLERAHTAIWSRIGRAMDSGGFIPFDKVAVPMSTFSGMPYLTRTDKVYSEILNDAQAIYQRVVRGEDFEYYFSVLGHRGQSKGLYSLPKQRIVWQYPKAPVLVGLSWMQSVLPHLARLDEFVGWNHWTYVDSYVQRLLDTAESIHSNVVSMDFSQFDATVSDVLVRPLFQRTGLSKQLTPILNDFFTSSIALPGELRMGRIKGVPSGHAWTNFVDCLANLTCIYYVAERTGRQVVSCSVLGDDSLVVYDKPIDLEEMSEIAAELGLNLGAAKSVASDDYCHFLQKAYFRRTRSGGIRSVMRTLNSMISMERWSGEVSPWYHVARWWMQLDEVRAHPCRQEFLEWTKSRDRYSLGSGTHNLAVVDETIAKSSLMHERAWRGEFAQVPTSYWFRSYLHD